MSIPLPTYTVDMVRAFPDDGQRYELVEGMLLVTPAPASDHQVVISRLMTALNIYLGPNGPAYVVSPGEIEVAQKLHLEPDLLVYPSTFRPGTKWTQIDGWWLAVEVLSPSSKHYDRDYKLEAYLRVGVAEVWMVDLDRGCCEVSGVDAFLIGRLQNMLTCLSRHRQARSSGRIVRGIQRGWREKSTTSWRVATNGSRKTTELC